MNREKKIAKKIILFRNENSFMERMWRYLGVTTLKITDIKPKKDGQVYNVEYKEGFRLYNPFTWILILLSIIVVVFESVNEIVEELSTSTYTTQIKIKNKEGIWNE